MQLCVSLFIDLLHAVTPKRVTRKRGSKVQALNMHAACNRTVAGEPAPDVRLPGTPGGTRELIGVPGPS